MEIISDDEDEEDEVISLNEEKFKPTSLEKMVTLIAVLVEKSRGDGHELQLTERTYNALVGGKVSHS